jgi:S1-C subfamily serine protease
LPRRLVYEYQLKESTGILIVSVQDKSPASHANLREGDIIIALGDQPLAGIDAMYRLLTAECAGKSLSIEILRGVEKLQLSIRPETKPEE